MKRTLLFLMLLCWYGGWCQPYYFNHYQVEDGLSNNTVFSIIQDHHGFIWFGTRDGLNKFDGYSFKVFKSDFDVSSSIESNFIRCLAEDNEGKIWVGTDQGIYIFDPVFERFEILNDHIKDEVITIEIDKKGDVWFISDTKLHWYHQDTGLISRPVQYDNISSLYLNPENSNIWVGTSSGEILKISAKDGVLEHFETTGNAEARDKRIEKIFSMDSHRLIIGTRKQGVEILNLKTGDRKEILSKDYRNEGIYIRDILHYKNSEYWFASESGIISIDFESGRHIFIKKEKNNELALSDNAVYTLLKDKEDGIWAGTFFGGVNYYSESNSFFKKFFPNLQDNSIAGYAVREIVEDKNGKLWIGTEDNGLSRYDPENGTFKNYLPTRDSTSLSFSNIHGLLASGDTLWIGTFEHGLDLMDINSGKVIKHYRAESQEGSLHSNFILNILKTRTGKILLATDRGIYKYKPSTEPFYVHPHFPDYIFYTSLYEDEEGVIWAGTWRDGLYYYDRNTDNSGRFIRGNNRSKNLLSNRINRIFQDRRGFIWIASEGGLSKYDKDTNLFQHFTTREGMPSNLVFSIEEDREGILWVSTSKGMVRFDPLNNSMVVLTKENGLLSDQFNYNSSFKDRYGNFYFGSVKGLIYFNPSEFPVNNSENRVYITGIQIHDQEVEISEADSPLDSAITFTKKIVLKPDQASFSLDFSSLSYTNPSLKEYAYKMEGLDKDWTFLKSNRRVYFTDLRPGDYKFRVSLVNDSKDFKGKEAELAIVVLPVFWMSNTAFALYTILFILILIVIIWNYDQRIKTKNRRRLERINHLREKALYQAKIDFFTSVVHEIRTPLSLIKAPLERIMERLDPAGTKNRKTEKYLALIAKNTDRLLLLSNQLLDFRKIEADNFRLSSEAIDLVTLIDEVCTNFKFSLEKDMKITFNKPRQAIFMETDKESITKIISNLIGNAVKYGEHVVDVVVKESFENKNRIIEIGIASDGQKIPEQLKEKIFEPFFRLRRNSTQRGTGIGLPLSRSLAHLLGGSLTLSTDCENQNVFILKLPKSFKNHDGDKQTQSNRNSS